MSEPGHDHDGERAVVSFSMDDIPELKQQTARGRPYAERLSLGLVFRLLTGLRAEAPYILDEIDALEGLRPGSRSKPASQFQHPPLHPLWHKHFVAPRHFVPNLGARWSTDRGGNRDLDRMIHEVAVDHGDDVELWPGVLADRFVDGFGERSQAGKLTGDWIVFAVHQGARYYLDVAQHEEGKADRAAGLLQKLKGSAQAEFPFAFAQHASEWVDGIH